MAANRAARSWKITSPHAHNQRKAGEQPGFAGKEALDVPAGHAQGQIHAELPPAQLQHEAGGIAEHQRRDQTGQHHDHGEHTADIRGQPGKHPDPVAVAEVVDSEQQGE